MFLRRGFSVSGFRETEEEEQARLFLSILGFCFLMVLLTILLIWPILADSPAQLALTLTTLLITAAGWLAAWRRRLDITRALVSAGYWLLVTLLVLVTGGLSSPWLMTQLAIVGVTGLVVGGRASLSLTLMTVLVDGVFYFLQGSMGGPSATGNAIEFLASLIINFSVIGAVVYLTNRVVRRNTERARDNELRYRSLFDKTNDAVFLISLDNRCMSTNEQAARMLGYSREELVGMHIDQIVAPEERERAHAVAGRLQEESILPVYERTMVRKDGSRITTEINVAMITDPSGKPLHIQSVVRDVTERKRLEQQLRDNLEEIENIAMQDPLTGLLNRRAIVEHVEVEWHRSQREQQPMCVLLIDMDNLKGINDQHGHKMGDKALVQLANALRQAKRRYDWMGRWGGDEFMMVLPNTNLVEAREVAERCRATVEAEPVEDEAGDLVGVRASVGLACYSGRPGDQVSKDMLLAQADQALYSAKEGGRNKVSVYRD